MEASQSNVFKHYFLQHFFSLLQVFRAGFSHLQYLHYLKCTICDLMPSILSEFYFALLTFWWLLYVWPFCSPPWLLISLKIFFWENGVPCFPSYLLWNMRIWKHWSSSHFSFFLFYFGNMLEFLRNMLESAF